MVKSTIYKGIEFVKLVSLPKEEQEIFLQSFNRRHFIKIMINDEVIHDCIQYKDYVLWHNGFFKAEKGGAQATTLQTLPKSVEAVEAKQELVRS